jgi:hypothetical protein
VPVESGINKAPNSTTNGSGGGTADAGAGAGGSGSGSGTTPVDGNAAATKEDVVLHVGHHIVVMLEQKVVVDYTFGAPPEKPKAAQSGDHQEGGGSSETGGHQEGGGGSETGDDTEQGVTQKDGGTTIGAAKKTLGPLSISNVCLIPKQLDCWPNVIPVWYPSQRQPYLLTH